MIYLVRHGETALNAARVVQPANTPLNQNGFEQARLLSKRLKNVYSSNNNSNINNNNNSNNNNINNSNNNNKKKVRLIVSDLQRTIDTAMPIQKELGIAKMELSPLFQERDFGDVRGTPYDQLKANIFDFDYLPPNGENGEMFLARVKNAWKYCLSEYDKDQSTDLIIVTHGLFLKVLTENCLTLPEGVAETPSNWGNTSLTILDPTLKIVTLNCTDHLLNTSLVTPKTISGL